MRHFYHGRRRLLFALLSLLLACLAGVGTNVVEGRRDSPKADSGNAKTQGKRRSRQGRRSSSGGEDVCAPVRGLNFNPTPSRRKARSNPLSFCTRYWKDTCCNKSHTDVLLKRDRIVAAAKFSPSCRAATELLLCSSCHPSVGKGQMKHMCSHTCDSWFEACRQEFYAAPRSLGSPLVPCLENAVICSRLDAIVSSGSEFCSVMGYTHVQGGDGSACFDGTVPATEGVPEKEESNLDDLFSRYRSHSGRSRGLGIWRRIERNKHMLAGVFGTALAGTITAMTVYRRLAGRGRRLGTGSNDDFR